MMYQPVTRATSTAVALTLLLAATRAAPAQTDVVSRELTVNNLLAEPLPNLDAISRELTVENQLIVIVESLDAVSREVTALNDLAGEAKSDVISRELSARNQLVDTESPRDALTREASVFNGLAYVDVSSSSMARAWPVGGSLPAQITALNAAPPPYDPNTWLPVARRNDNVDDAFLCGAVPDPLTRGYVSAQTYLFDDDEVTFDNCSSAFYRFTFELPPDALLASLGGWANVDDQGVARINGVVVSGLMSNPGCSPADPANPFDPCYLQQDAGRDKFAAGRAVLTWPSLDPLEVRDPNVFVPGQNVAVFAVVGNAQAFEPTGVEFAAAVLYFKRGDVNCDGEVNFADIDPFVLALAGGAAYADAYPYCRIQTADANCNGTIEFGDIDAFVACLSGDCVCP